MLGALRDMRKVYPVFRRPVYLASAGAGPMHYERVVRAGHALQHIGQVTKYAPPFILDSVPADKQNVAGAKLGSCLRQLHPVRPTAARRSG